MLLAEKDYSRKIQMLIKSISIKMSRKIEKKGKIPTSQGNL